MNRRNYLIFVAVINFFLLCFTANASVESVKHVQVRLKKIEKIKSSESNDELFFAITKFSNKERSAYEQVPGYPLYWNSDKLDKINELVLWEGDVTQGESIRLIISLIEHDAPPFYLDDLLGSSKLTLTNSSGELSYEWGVPQFSDLPEVELKVKSGKKLYTYKGENSHYNLEYEVNVS